MHYYNIRYYINIKILDSTNESPLLRWEGEEDRKLTVGGGALTDPPPSPPKKKQIRYSPQTSICVYLANDSDYLLSTGANNKGVFDIFRSQVYDPVGGRNIANSYVEVSPCD